MRGGIRGAVRSPIQTQAQGVSPYDFAMGMASIQKFVDELEALKQEHRAMMQDTSGRIDDLIVQGRARIALAAKGDKGERGDKGDSVIGPMGPAGGQGPKGERGEAGRIGKDGKDGRDGKDGQDGKDADPEDVAQVIKSKKLLKIDHIDGLREEMSAYRNQLALHGGMRGGGDIITVSDQSANCNGSNKTFTLPKFMKIVMVIGTDAPIIYRPTTDYTTSGGTTLTLTGTVNAPSSGATFLILYVA